MGRKNIYHAIIIFFIGFFSKYLLDALAKNTQKLLEEKPDQRPYCGSYLDEEEDDLYE